MGSLWVSREILSIQTGQESHLCPGRWNRRSPIQRGLLTLGQPCRRCLDLSSRRFQVR